MVIDKSNDKNHHFELEMKVRDYECDLQGIVNNSVYQNYLEHTRHEYLKSVGIDFADFAKRGINLVVARSELDYKMPLKSGDSFKVTLRTVRESRIRFAFYQDVYRIDRPDEKADKTTATTLCLNGKIIGTAINSEGRPFLPPELSVIFQS